MRKDYINIDFGMEKKTRESILTYSNKINKEIPI